ncbi:MAG: hypothetical protein Q9213_003160 [Squamulea squamosa]
MKRSAEKTFGQSPESLANVKRQKRDSQELGTFSPSEPAKNNNSDSTDARIIPPSQLRVKRKHAFLRTGGTNRRTRPVEAMSLGISDLDVSTTGNAVPTSLPTRQSTASAIPIKRSSSMLEASDNQSSSTNVQSSNGARIGSSNKPRHEGNILERLGSFPGLSPPSTTYDDSEDDESDDTSNRKSNSAKPKPKSTRQLKPKKEITAKIIAAIDL